MKTLKNQMFLLWFEDLEVLEKALGVLGGSCGGALGALGGSWEVPERSLGILGAPGWILEGSLGPLYGETFQKHLFF